MKKCMLLLLAVVLMLLAVPMLTEEVRADGLQYATYDGVTYEYAVYDGKATIYGVKGSPEEVNIPSKLGVYPVKKIANLAFEENSSIKKITIPDGVTTIGRSAFLDSDLREITIPSSVTSIGEYAFENCLYIEKVYITDLSAWCRNSLAWSSNPLHCGADLYLNNTLVTKLTIPSGITDVGSAFSCCTSLTEVTFPYGVTDTGDFYFCRNLTKVTIPNSVTTIGSFSGCTSLTEITIPNRVTTIGDFDFCTSLTEITIPKSVTTIGSFSECTSLTEITIPNGVTTIGSFSECTSLTEITIPNSVTEIPFDAFEGCTSLTEVTLPDSITFIPDRAFSSCDKLTELAIPNSVTRIGSDAFDGCTSLAKIYITDLAAWCRITFRNNTANPLSNGCDLYLNGTVVEKLSIPNSVTSIDSYVFYGCTSLTEVTIPDGVTEIGYRAFSNCTSLTEVTIPDGVTEIGYRAFSNCTGITNITIPNSVTSIDSYAFYDCTSLANVYITDLAAWCQIKFYGGAANPLSYGARLYWNDALVTELIIPSGITQIGDYAFWNYSRLKSITIPKSVTSIGEGAFNSFSSNRTVNYSGYRKDFRNISIESDNASFINAKWNYAVCIGSHGYDNSCDAVCNVCEEVRTVGDHVYTNSCDTTCNYCGVARTITHTYDNVSDLTCNICKESIKPSAPKLKSYTTNSITLVAVKGLEYCCENGSWQSSNVFTGLEPGTSYSFYQRVAESATAKVSEASDSMYAYTQGQPPRIQAKTDTSITIYVRASYYTYSLDGVNWRDSGNSSYYTFYNLTPGTTYTVYEKERSDIPAGMLKVTTYRHIGTVSYHANGGKDAPDNQTKIEKTPLKLSVQKPVRSGCTFMGWATTTYGEVAYQPGDEYTLDTDLTLYAMWGYNCTTCGGDGDNSSKCTNCNGSGTVYYTEEGCPSCSSISITQYFTNYGSYYKCGWCGNISYYTKSVTMSTSCQSCSGSGSDKKACTDCAGRGWLKDVHPKAPAPKLERKDYVSVTLKAQDGMEYSMDGTTWQESNVFARLDPGTKYRFYQRYKETGTHKATNAGNALVVTTNGIPTESVTLKKIGGVWKYYVGNTFVPITTVVSFSGSRYYVYDGVVPSDYTGWKEHKGEQLYLKNGRLLSNGLHKLGGVWYYIKNGAHAANVTSLVKYNNEWFYVVEGKVASNTTTLVKLNGEWWYVVKGKVAGNTTTLIKYNGEWWYVVKGKIASNTTNLVKYNNEWWYVVKGKIASKTTTLIKYNGGWYYIFKGKLAAKTTTLVEYSGKWYYVEKGKVNFSKTGLVKYSGTWYYIKDGVKSNATTFVSHSGQKYYVKSGVAQTQLSGAVGYNGATYYLNKGVLTNCHTKGHQYLDATCTKPKTCKYCTVTYGKPKGHSAGEATCTQEGVCRVCGIVVSEPLGHDYSGNYCKRCGLISGVHIQIPQLPCERNEYNYSNEILQTCTITDISFEYEYKDGDYKHFEIIINGYCTFNIDGNDANDSMWIYFKIYDSEGVLVGSDYLHTADVAVGDRFVTRGGLGVGLKPGETYTLVFYNN